MSFLQTSTMDEDKAALKDCVVELITNAQPENEKEKARILFVWLSTRDLMKLNFGKITKGTPDDVLHKLKRKKLTYATVYQMLCSIADMKCEVVRGYSKGTDYRPGMELTESNHHSWNAVYADNQWKLVDCNWAAMSFWGERDIDNLRYKLDDFFFMPSPEECIYFHFPHNDKWQLLKYPISLKDFQNQVMLKSNFFKCGLTPDCLSHQQAVIHCDSKMLLRLDLHSNPHLKSLHGLFHIDGRDTYDHRIKLDRFGMVEVTDDYVIFSIRLPQKEEYELRIYVTDTSGFYPIACHYKIIATKDPPVVLPFPLCQENVWGCLDKALEYGITAMQEGAVFTTSDGQIDLKFRSKTAVQYKFKLKDGKTEGKLLHGHVLQRALSDTEYVVTVRPPCGGEFGLEVWISNSNEDYLYLGYQYLIQNPAVSGPVPAWPVLPANYLGPSEDFVKFGLSVENYPDPYIMADESEIELTLHETDPLRWTSNLLHVTSGGRNIVSSYCFRQHKDKQITFKLKFPKIGTHILETYARPEDETTKTAPNVYNCQIDCHNPAVDLNPYPSQFSRWRTGCYLYYPLLRKLEVSSEGTVDFKADIPDVDDVAVVVGKVWSRLKPTSLVTWEGSVRITPSAPPKKLTMCAQMRDSGKFMTLLEFEA